MTARKAAAKKAPAKKASKKAATKKAAKKAVKTAAKKAVKKAAAKPAAKKAVAKKTAAKKSAPKNASVKKAAKKAAAPKATPKKAAAKKVVAKKTASKKVAVSSKAKKGKEAVAAILSRKPAAKKAKGVARKAVKKASRSELLKKLLALRAKQTAKTGHKAAADVRKGAGETRVPTSVAKAAEFAQTRKISSMVAQQPEEKDTKKEAAKKKRRRRKAPYTKTELRELREILQSERMRLLKDMEVLDARKAEAEAGNRTFSNHQADAATDSSAMETMFVTRRYEEERLGQVVGALERLEKGDYGLCDMCEDEPQKLCESCPFIPIGRLRAKPFARLCVPCREQLEKKKKR